MVQSSGPWDGSSFAEDEWRKLFKALIDGRQVEGIAASLDITRSVSNRDVTIGAGRAIVQGMLYENTANVVFSIPTPSGSNQRIDYIVLRYDTSEPLATRIELALVQGAEALSGAIPPALTQNHSGIWEHPLCVIGPYGSGVISAAPFALVSPVITRRAFIPIGSYASPNDIPGIAGNLRDELYDEYGRTWQKNSSGVWVLGSNAPVWVISETDLSVTTASPSFSAGSTVCGRSFVVPPSGAFSINIYALMQSANNGNACQLSFEIRLGGTVGAGSILVAASQGQCLSTGMAVTSGGPARIGASAEFPFSGYTPGDTLNVRTMHNMIPGGSGSMFKRQIIVKSHH
jgi:hypothetical protein